MEGRYAVGGYAVNEKGGGDNSWSDEGQITERGCQD